jgi:hypothetical protein
VQAVGCADIHAEQYRRHHPSADRDRCSRGDIDRLLDAGCLIDAVDTAGRTALWYATGTGTMPWTPDQQATRFRVLQHLLDRGADPSIAARGAQGRPIDAARGLHQAKKYRHEWAQGAALLEDHGQ